MAKGLSNLMILLKNPKKKNQKLHIILIHKHTHTYTWPSNKNNLISIIEYLPATKAVRKFGGKGAAREKAEVSSRIRRSKLVTSVRSNIMRRRLANRNRDAVRRAKLMRRYYFKLSFHLSITTLTKPKPKTKTNKKIKYRTKNSQKKIELTNKQKRQTINFN